MVNKTILLKNKNKKNDLIPQFLSFKDFDHWRNTVLKSSLYIWNSMEFQLCPLQDVKTSSIVRWDPRIEAFAIYQNCIFSAFRCIVDI